MSDTIKKVKYIAYIVLSLLLVWLLAGQIQTFAETPAPDATVAPAPSESTPTAEASPTAATEAPGTEEPATEQPSPPPTQTVAPPPTAEPVTPTPVPPTELPATLEPTIEIMPTLPTLVPTPTPQLNFLYDFTAPPLKSDDTSHITLQPDHTPAPTMSSATIGVVQIDDIDNTARGFRWSDLIKYAAYLFYGLAGLSVIYGMVCLIGLLCFKKDLSIGALRARRKETHKDRKK